MGKLKFILPQRLVQSLVNKSKDKPENFVEVNPENEENSQWASSLFKNIYKVGTNTELSELIGKLSGKTVFTLDILSYQDGNKLKDDLQSISKSKGSIVFINNIDYLGGINPNAKKNENWPAFDEIYSLCKGLFSNYYITILDGNLLCAPKESESIVTAYWVETYEERFYTSDPEPRKRTLMERVISRSKRMLRKNAKKEPVAYNIRGSVWFENECKKFKEAHKWLQEQNFKSIVDIGANVGQFGKKIRQYYPDAKLFSFEPIPFVCDELNLNFKDDKNFKSFNVGLGDSDGKTKFFMNLFSDSSSMLPVGELHKKNFPYTKDEIEIEVTVKQLDNCFEKGELEKPYLVKIDVQGFEEQVINGGIEVIKNADMIITESSYKELYEGQSLFDSLYEKLKGFGFEFIGNLEQMESAFNGEPLQGDAIFQKRKNK